MSYALGKTSHIPVIEILYTAAFVGMLICASLLMRRFFRAHRNEWEQEGCPIGPLWAPEGKRNELLYGVASSSYRKGTRLLFYTLVFTPEVFREEMRTSTSLILYSYRILFLLCGIFLVISLATG